MGGIAAISYIHGSVMIRVTKKPNLKLNLPDSRFWRGVGVDGAKTIRKRTERGIGLKDGGRRGDSKRMFKPYSPGYAKYRKEHGRRTKPNLVFTGRMLGAIGRGVSVIKNGTRITLSGRQGAKAWFNEKIGRKFFDVTKKEADSIMKRVDKWMSRGNKLK